ncbi:MAG: ATP-dependent RNA helicase [Verrucomicrobia bacterium]|nr:ATP-dependent RNA helicase [Verrucomicrobiota bacterium]
MNNFSALGLSEQLLKVLQENGFEHPTPIQQKSIPYILQNDRNDFIGLAQTGTGKTAAFGLPLIELVDSTKDHTQALVLSPTRELGQQTAKQLSLFSKAVKGLNIEVVYGGAAIQNQIKALKQPTQIIVATPGRLLDLIRRRVVELNEVKYMVLDEADEMLNMGFKEEIDDILSNIKGEFNTWLFSATMPKPIRKIVQKYMQDPFEVSIDAQQKTNKDIAHQYIVTKTKDKLTAVRRFLDIDPDLRAIMFCRTKRETQEIADQLTDLSYDVEALHGDLSQAQRDAAMRRFKSKDMQLLIATDVAARGIDVNNLTHVFHHKLPDQIEGYTHRSGRTARAGKKGISLAFVHPEEGRRIKEIEQSLKLTFEKVEIPGGDNLKKARITHWAKQLKDIEVAKSAAEFHSFIEDQFFDLSKEELLLKLVSKELKSLDQNNDSNLNAELSSKRRSSDKSFGERDQKNQRYVINVGKEDGLNKSIFIDFIADVSRVNSKHISDVALQDNRAFFSVSKDQINGFAKKFDGLELENGHSIQLKEEHSKPQHNGGGDRRRNRRDNRRPGGGHRSSRNGGGKRRRY